MEKRIENLIKMTLEGLLLLIVVLVQATYSFPTIASIILLCIEKFLLVKIFFSSSIVKKYIIK